MLHVDGPQIRKIKTTRVEAVVDLSEPTDAKGFVWRVNKAMTALEKEGSAKGFDDEFYAVIRGGELVLYFEKEKEQ